MTVLVGFLLSVQYTRFNRWEDVCDQDVCDHLFVTKTFVTRTFVTIPESEFWGFGTPRCHLQGVGAPCHQEPLDHHQGRSITLF